MGGVCFDLIGPSWGLGVAVAGVSRAVGEEAMAGGARRQEKERDRERESVFCVIKKNGKWK